MIIVFVKCYIPKGQCEFIGFGLSVPFWICQLPPFRRISRSPMTPIQNSGKLQAVSTLYYFKIIVYVRCKVMGIFVTEKQKIQNIIISKHFIS